MTSALKKKIIVAAVITIVLGILYYQSAEREKSMKEFTKMQQAPIQEAEKGQTK